MEKHIFGLLTLLFSVFWVFSTVVAAYSVKDWLDEETLVYHGG